MAGFLLVAGGCAKRIASPDMTFGSHQKVVLTFSGGEELEGRVAPGKRVERDGPEQAYATACRRIERTVDLLQRGPSAGLFALAPGGTTPPKRGKP